MEKVFKVVITIMILWLFALTACKHEQAEYYACDICKSYHDKNGNKTQDRYAESEEHKVKVKFDRFISLGKFEPPMHIGWAKTITMDSLFAFAKANREEFVKFLSTEAADYEIPAYSQSMYQQDIRKVKVRDQKLKKRAKILVKFDRLVGSKINDKNSSVVIEKEKLSKLSQFTEEELKIIATDLPKCRVSKAYQLWGDKAPEVVKFLKSCKN